MGAWVQAWNLAKGLIDSLLGGKSKVQLSWGLGRV